ncbi:hypothetical protein [Pseudomaricurvus sp. HS19]|uniref:hypothetical protein n=1 Tax=Pseudomaricurvus sp. HS19 TaxID=2692626 RepID=UPI0013694E08|nr:hypothetical protein [Pseudomaricurvus sp. HS19]MYM63597.1 hypothetical protein [Pseudomaricurvus sp. HS19]
MLLLIGFAPMLSAWALYLGQWQPQTNTARGALMQPALTAEQWWPAANTDSLEQLHGHWLIVEVLPADCDRNCVQQLQQVTQLHLALGKEAERVRRVWFGTTTPTQADDPYLQILPHSDLQVPQQRQRFIVDPLGNLVLTYTQDQDLRDLLKDLKKLLKASSIG